VCRRVSREAPHDPDWFTRHQTTVDSPRRRRRRFRSRSAPDFRPRISADRVSRDLAPRETRMGICATDCAIKVGNTICCDEAEWGLVSISCPALHSRYPSQSPPRYIPNVTAYPSTVIAPILTSSHNHIPLLGCNHLRKYLPGLFLRTNYALGYT